MPFIAALAVLSSTVALAVVVVGLIDERRTAAVRAHIIRAALSSRRTPIISTRPDRRSDTGPAAA